ncbi:DUF2066 domain-containing protein [Parvibaculum sp.]|uniref:DUF2066 domain-containing protein n=1 Tax=Parvibaculum sp. TaxID=2024848 RepID=UPI001DADB753|nr:DUF2066 domain-containing protein [Parvibaculum sp.]MBX3491081.1 DUF2066 domain-containing protein [Parvibaculum sp.]MCW5728901.1 DUF2066 domain-containing protein [Parvibaculum sp.]
MISAIGVLRAPGLALAILASIAAPALANDIFTVRGIAVDRTADTATAARAAAQAEGQRLALAEVMKKLTLPEDWGALPEVDEATAQGAVRGFQVANERTSATRYIAEMIVSFQPEAVRRMLRGANIPFGETQARPAVLLPVLRRDDRRILWDDDNPWRGAWASLDLVNAMTPLVLPLGDIAEINSVTPDVALSSDENTQAALSEMAANYGAADVVVAEAVLSGGRLDVTLTTRGAAASAPIRQSFSGADEAELMRNAARTMLDAMALQWKRQIIVRDTSLHTLTASASFASLEEWERIRNSLTTAPLVQGLEVLGISSNGAELRISYKGSAEMLSLSLSQRNVRLAGATSTQADPDVYSPIAAAAPVWRLSVGP